MIALLANADSVDIARVLTDLLILLVTARLAGELAERVRVPAVLGEIAAGLLIGPSMFGWVAGSSALTVLAEIGVILLLLDVGLETDLRELGQVGRSSLAVAVVGVAAPMAGGFVAMLLFGESVNTAIFVGAALTATSVGITARVFGDLGALGSVAARTVLGAAVADDVLGLVLLTVVVKMLTTGSISVGSVAATVLLAVGYLVVVSGVGMYAVPRLVRAVSRRARGAGTPVVLAFAITLAFARAADVAHLAPIIGAFVAGLCLARSEDSEAIRHQLSGVGHLFVPVFFLRIGIDADVAQTIRGDVLALAAVLAVVAIVGKLLAGLAAGRRTDRLLVGFGMIPRGEVGLIFAGLGLSSGLLTSRLYAAVLLVVLATTVLAPVLLKWRIGATTSRSEPDTLLRQSAERPSGGWFEYGDDTIELAALPHATAAAVVAFTAAANTRHLRPGPLLIDWLGAAEPPIDRLGTEAFDAMAALVAVGGMRGWRLLDTTGFLRRVVPELADLLAERRRDPHDLDAADGLSFETASGLRAPSRSMLLAALAADRQLDARVATVVGVGERFGLDDQCVEEATWLVANVDRLTVGARRLDGMSERELLELAVDAGDVDRARRLAELSCARKVEPVWVSIRRDELAGRMVQSFDLPEVRDTDARDIISARRSALLDRVDDNGRSVVDRAPRSWLMSQPIERLESQVSLAVGALANRRPGVRIAQSNGRVLVDLAALDDVGLLARSAAVLSEAGADIVSGEVSVWDDIGVSSFVVNWRMPLSAEQVASNLQDAIEQPLIATTSSPPEGIEVEWPVPRSPWTSPLHVTGVDRPHALADICRALSATGAIVQSARIGGGAAGQLDDHFELTDSHGRPLDERARRRVETALLWQSSGRRHRRARRRRPSIAVG